MFNYPRAICFSQFHNSLFVCDDANNRIRGIDLKTGITTIATSYFKDSHLQTGNVTSIGSGVAGFKDGLSEEAQFLHPTGIACSESDGSLLVTDYAYHKIRKIIFSGMISLP